MNGLKYLTVASAVLFVAVYGMTSCGNKKDKEESGVTETAVLVSEAVTDTPDNEKPKNEYNKNGERIFDVSEATVKPDPDPDGADNTWAMFLVNEANPLPHGYDEQIETKFVTSTYRDYYMDARMSDYLVRMLEAAEDDGVQLTVTSTYRTYQYQKENFDKSVRSRMNNGLSYKEAYNDTLISVQRPGQSEHNAGLAVDILSDEYPSMEDDGFEDTEAFRWLSKHAEEYGFILRYPKGKTDITNIIYEPWHYRFVGIYYAKQLNESGLTLEEYFAEKGWVDENGRAIQHTVYDRNSDMPLSVETYTTEEFKASETDEFEESENDEIEY